MAKYHLTDNGPALCKVVTGKCPFGGEHFPNKAEARKVYEQTMSDANPLAGKRPRPEIALANQFLDFEKNPPISLEDFDSRLAQIEADRAELGDLYAKAEKDEYNLSPDESQRLADLREQSNAAMLDLLTVHESEILALKQVHQTISTLDAEAKTSPNFDYDEMIPLYDKVREREEYKNYLRDVLDEQKTNLAIATVMEARAERKAMEERGEYLRFDGEELVDAEGNVVGRKTVYFPSGSQEWHEERSKGIGGSDVGYIVGASKVAKKPALDNGDGTWTYLNDVRGYPVGNQADLINKKLETENNWEDHRSLPGTEPFHSAAGRGDAWEESLLIREMKLHPGEVAYCKSSYASVEDPSMRYNFDGLMLDKETGRPNGVIEFKTASHVDHWGNPDDGLDGVPGSYRAQVLHYALNAGFDRGQVTVAINDHEVRTYSFNFNDSPELREEAEANRVKAQALVEKVAEVRATGATSFAKPTRNQAAFSVAQLDPKNLASKKRIFETAAAYRGITADQVKKEYVAARTKGIGTPDLPVSKEELAAMDKEEASALVKAHTAAQQKAQTDALRSLFTRKGDKDKRPENIVGIDLETSGLTPARGRILDLGIEQLAGGKRVKGVDETFGVGPYAKRHERGVGWDDLRAVHGITGEMLADKETFKPSPEVIRTLTKPGTVIMAHNASFETRWLSSYVPGFNNAVRNGSVRIVDSKDLSQWLDDTPGNSMNHYGYRWGVYGSLDGEEEHRAYADARDMMDAYQAQRAALRSHED